MLLAVTPRDEVLAWLTEAAEPPPGVVGVGVDADEDAVAAEGAVATHTMIPMTTAPTKATVRIWVARGRRTK